jgi:hypothetical protein
MPTSHNVSRRLITTGQGLHLCSCGARSNRFECRVRRLAFEATPSFRFLVAAIPLLCRICGNWGLILTHWERGCNLILAVSKFLVLQVWYGLESIFPVPLLVILDCLYHRLPSSSCHCDHGLKCLMAPEMSFLRLYFCFMASPPLCFPRRTL